MKRGKLELIRDILKVIADNNNSIKITPLIRQSNMSSHRFKEYYNEIFEKGFIKEIRKDTNEKFISLTDKGFRFLDKFRAIVDFIDEFEL